MLRPGTRYNNDSNHALTANTVLLFSKECFAACEKRRSSGLWTEKRIYFLYFISTVLVVNAKNCTVKKLFVFLSFDNMSKQWICCLLLISPRIRTDFCLFFALIKILFLVLPALPPFPEL